MDLELQLVEMLVGKSAIKLAPYLYRLVLLLHAVCSDGIVLCCTWSTPLHLLLHWCILLAVLMV